MKLYIHKKELLRDTFMKLFIFITVFYSFYISITDALGLSGIPAVIIAVIIVMGMFLTNNVKLHFKDVAVFLGFFILCLMNIWIFNVEISDYVKTFLFCCIPMILAGSVIDIEKYQGFIYKTSCLYTVVLFVYVARYYIGTLNLYSTDSMDIMGFAYYSMPTLLIIVYNYFKDKRLSNLLFLVLGALYLLICGTRGPILCLLVFGIFCVIMEIKNGSSIKKLWIVFLLVVAIVILINMRSIVLMLYPIFQRNGFSTRFFSTIINEGSLGGLNGRENIYETMMRHINSHAVMGGGFMEERTALRGYAHNLALETLNSFGIPIGSVLLIALLCLIIYSFVKTKSTAYKYYIAAYACIPFVKLMFSSSFLQEPSLYILIGICFGAIRTQKDIN